MAYQSKYSGKQIDEAVNEARALIGKSVVYCSTASVGQILEVAEVDENGRPIRWRAVDNHNGGGVSITDDGEGNVTIVASGNVSITDDGNGNVTIA